MISNHSYPRFTPCLWSYIFISPLLGGTVDVNINKLCIIYNDFLSSILYHVSVQFFTFYCTLLHMVKIFTYYIECSASFIIYFYVSATTSLLKYNLWIDSILFYVFAITYFYFFLLHCLTNTSILFVVYCTLYLMPYGNMEYNFIYVLCLVVIIM